MLLEYGLFSSAAHADGLDRHHARSPRTRSRCRSPRSCSWCRSASRMAATVRVGHAVGRGDSGRRRAAPASARSRSACAFMAAMTLIVVAAAQRHSAAVPRRADGATPQTARSPRTLLLLGASFFIADGVQTHRGRRAARAERHPRADAVCRDQLLGRRLHQLPMRSAFALGFGAFGVWIGFSLGARGLSPCC